MIVVADAGPLLHLHWVGAASWGLPPTAVFVVDEVWTEVECHAAEALQYERLVRVRAPTGRPPGLSGELHPGEAAAIAFALTRSDALVLCDEMAARETCAHLGLAVTGSIGLILEAVKEGRVEAGVATTALRELPSKGRLHVTDALIERALQVIQQR